MNELERSVWGNKVAPLQKANKGLRPIEFYRQKMSRKRGKS